MAGISLRLAGFLAVIGLAAMIAGGAPAQAAAPKSKFEQAKTKATIIYRKYYWAAQDASLLDDKGIAEEAAKLREQWEKALEEAVALDPSVRRANDAYRRAANKPEDKRDEDEVMRRTEDVQIVTQNASAEIESEIHERIFAVDDDDATAPAPKQAAAPVCPEDQKRAVALTNRISIYQKRLAEAENELRTINYSLANLANELTETQRSELNNKKERFERRIKVLKRDLEGFRKELDALSNKLCPPPPAASTPPDEKKKAEEKPTGGKSSERKTSVKKPAQRKDGNKNETGAGASPSISIDIGGGGSAGRPREPERSGERRSRSEERSRDSGGGFGTGGGGGGFGGGGVGGGGYGR